MLQNRFYGPGDRTSGSTEIQPGGLVRDSIPYSYLNRELSSIEFNRRVLEEALDTNIPLLERLRFLTIFANNLDEFFMIRVAGLKQWEAAKIHERPRDCLNPTEQLREISAKLRPILDVHHHCLVNDVLPALAAENLRVIPYRQLNRTQQKQMKDVFDRDIFPLLTPLVVDPGHPFPLISNRSLNLGIEVIDPENPLDIKFARVKVPESSVVPRLLLLGKKHNYVLLEELISAHMGRLFPGMTIKSCHPFRITRDADLEVDEEEAESLLYSIQSELQKRRFKSPVRMQVDPAMSPERIEILCKMLTLSADDVYRTPLPLGVADLAMLCDIDRPDLKFEPFTPVVPPVLTNRSNIFDAIREGDILFHHPFDSFDPVVRFVEEAARDDQVVAIKQTLYRTNGDSPIIQALIDAAAEGKQVVALLELKARFDEETNIRWAKALEECGVHVVWGVMGLKTHCKIALVVRKEGDTVRRYVHLGTGNYNPTTARVYTDLGLLTCQPDFGADASELFNYLTGFSKQARYRKLIVAPHNLRDRMIQLIQREERAHRPDNPGHIILKCNNLTDITLIDALYRAGRVGIRIDLIIRSTSCLKGNMPGLSENIRVLSVVGRFLEHSRIAYFKNGGQDEIYLGSADWMNRNLDRRIETVFPVDDPSLKARVRDQILNLYLEDNSRAHIQNPDGTYRRLAPQSGEPLIDCQEKLLDLVRPPILSYRT